MEMSQKITALKLQKRNQQRVNIYLDGEFAFGLAKTLAGWLQVGQELTEKKIEELREQDTLESGYQRALNFLSYRIRSKEEIRKNLLKHDIDEGSIEQIIERLQRNGLVDDQAFADKWVENRNTFRPRGRRALRMELRQKGIPDQCIEKALAALDEETLAYQAASKKSKRWKSLDEKKFKNKLYGFLARRGFEFEVIHPIVRNIWDERNQPTEEV